MLQRISMDVIDNKLDQIFEGNCWKKQGNLFEKRKMIYDYLVNDLSYDFEALENILNKGPRNYYKDIQDVLNNKKGVCHSISYIYKLLLSRIGTYALLIACNEKVESRDTKVKSITNLDKVGHMFTLVKNKDDTLSFDDPTNAIFYKGLENSNKFFNYDLDKTKVYNQEILGGFTSTFLDIMIIDRIVDKQNEEKFEKNTNRKGLSNIPADEIRSFKC